MKVLRRYKSRSIKGQDTWHLVTLAFNGGRGQVSCSCPGWQYHRHCWHVTKFHDQVLDALDKWLASEIRKHPIARNTKARRK